MKKAYTEVAEGKPRKKKPCISKESRSLIDQGVGINKILGARSERVKTQKGTRKGMQKRTGK